MINIIGNEGMMIRKTFKIIFTTYFYEIMINTNITSREMIKEISKYTKEKYPFIESDDIIEIIDSNNKNKIHSEFGEHYVSDDTIFLDTKTPNAFYLRPLKLLKNIIINNIPTSMDPGKINIPSLCKIYPLYYKNDNLNNGITYYNSTVECPVCYETTIPMLNLVCGHVLCQTCNNICIRRNINTCPCCRHRLVIQTI